MNTAMDKPNGKQLRGVVPLLQVGNMVDSLDYYQQVLGFSIDFSWPADGPPKWVMLSRADVHFLLTIDLGTSNARFIAEKGNGVVFYIITDDAEALYGELSARGAVVVQDIVNYGGRKQFSIADPSGYVIAFSEPFVV